MLRLLHIENIAVIERADIELENGLTVLSGETGAGKSILIDAIGAILGHRTSRELIRGGASKGFVSAVFEDIGDELAGIIREMELEGEEKDTLHIQRQISADGKSLCRVNMRPAPVSALKALSPYLINIHGQHDGQKLMDEAYHTEFLDSFGGAGELLARYLPHYQKLHTLKQEITKLDKSEQERLQRIDLLEFHVQEIAEAGLTEGEDALLEEKKAVFDNAGKLIDALNKAHIAVSGLDETAPGAAVLLSDAADALAKVSEVSGELQALYRQAEELRYMAEDFQAAAASHLAGIDFSPAERELVEARLDLIYRLKQKYGQSVSEILAYHAEAVKELASLQDADQTRLKLREEYKAELVKAKEAAAKLTELRRMAARNLEKRIVSELADLDMTKARLEIRVETGSKLTPNGMDAVAFYISVNPGEPVKLLSKVASGGELSRIMLAVKRVLTDGEPVDTLIFDEIDTGVSGQAAHKIARKLAGISRKKQTLCVTHLPQIAAMGDRHLLIAKNIKDGHSFTAVTPLREEERENEIARMISGEQITNITRGSAKELLKDAAAIKMKEYEFDESL